MKYTEFEALKEIFESKPLSATMTVYRHRWKKGVLSQKVIIDLLNKNGFTIVQETLYTKK